MENGSKSKARLRLRRASASRKNYKKVMDIRTSFSG
ncbi:uncharacterized protein FFB14_01462 [Fusarium fujikuroi]|nr:uncharacterized protein FFB14_01462 [Fusarium fujikuroi]